MTDPKVLNPPRILVVDDEVELTRALCEMLTLHGYMPECVSSPRAALALLQEQSFDVMLADLMMPEMDGIALLKEALQLDPDLVGIIMTGQGTVQTAVESMKSGAFDYLLKPFKITGVLASIDRALEFRRLRRENFQLREMLNIYELGQVVSSTLDIEAVLKKTTEAAQDQCQADEASIVLPEQGDGELMIAIATGENRAELVGQRIPVTGSISGWVLEQHEPLILHHEVKDPRFTDVYPRSDIQTSISMPMVHGSKAVGVINLNKTRRTSELTENQIKGLRILVSIAASAIENARLLEESQREVQATRQRERELEAIAAVSAAMRTVVSRQQMVPAILQQISAIFNTEHCVVGLLENGGKTLSIAGGAGAYLSLTGVRLAAADAAAGTAAGAAWEAVRSMKPVYMNTAQINNRPRRVEGKAPSDLSVLLKLQPAACVPLIAQDTCIGVLWLDLDHPVSFREASLLASVADIAANSIQRAVLYEQTEKRLQQLSALRTIDLAISSSLDLRVVLSVFLDQVVTQLSVDTAAMLLHDNRTHLLEFSAARGFRTNFFENFRPLSVDELAGEAAVEQKTVQVDSSRSAELVTALQSVEGIQTCFVTPLVAKGEIKGILLVGLRSSYDPLPDWLTFLEALAGQAAIAIDSARLFTDLQRSNRELFNAYNATIEGWSRALDLRDKETEGHTRRVTDWTIRLAQRIGGFNDEDLLHIRQGALLHDIGKMGVPDPILFKPSGLTEEEWAIMRMHPVYAYQLLQPISYLRKALDIPYYHHERWNGSGYPHGLKGEQIPLPARIFAVIDVWDALRSDRPYRKGWPEEEINRYLRDHAGVDFDPAIVEAFFEMMREANHSARLAGSGL